jgi:hypothetical protein
MDTKEVSPYKPEHFSRIPKELRQVILEQPLGTKTFSAEEATWIWENQQKIVIFRSRDDGYCRVEYRERNTEYFKGTLALTNPISFIFSYNITQNTAQYAGEAPHMYPIEWSYMKPAFGFIRFLTDTLDSTTVSKMHGHNQIVCTDLFNIYTILRRRFNIAIPEHTIYLAKKYTQQALDNIVDDHQDKKLPALLGYLAINAHILLDSFDITKYIEYDTEYILDDEYFDMILRRCTRLYKDYLQQYQHYNNYYILTNI